MNSFAVLWRIPVTVRGRHTCYTGALRIAGTRVGLASVIAHFQEGQIPEQLAEAFPTVTLAQAYGAIAYYLENKKLIDDFTLARRTARLRITWRTKKLSMLSSRKSIAGSKKECAL